MAYRKVPATFRYPCNASLNSLSRRPMLKFRVLWIGVMVCLGPSSVFAMMDEKQMVESLVTQDLLAHAPAEKGPLEEKGDGKDWDAKKFSQSLDRIEAFLLQLSKYLETRSQVLATDYARAFRGNLDDSRDN